MTAAKKRQGAVIMSRKLLATVLSTIPFFASFAIAQDKPVTLAPGCGAQGVKFEVKTIKGQQPAAQPESGKALVYFFQDDSELPLKPRPTTRLGMDGDWLGATHGDSYFYFSAARGIHHLCVSWQATEIANARTAALHFTAEAGGIYYFGVRDRLGISFHPLDSDEGQFLLTRLTFSTSHPKK
jgi:hypothetical protein